LQYNGWKVFCISTSYAPYARHIAHKLGIYNHNVASTLLPIDGFRQALGKEDRQLIERAEQDILTMRPFEDDNRIKQYLDDFFWQKLPATDAGSAMRQVESVGGRRKVAALERFAAKHEESLSRWVVIGDSITDFRMLRAVETAGGLAIAFNANEYALPSATMGLASTFISDLTDVLKAWKEGARQKAERVVREREKAGGQGDRGYFHWLAGRKDLDEVIAVHKRIRRLVREAASELG
jgi:energy-converting hydrogenase A subunit R